MDSTKDNSTLDPEQSTTSHEAAYHLHIVVKPTRSGKTLHLSFRTEVQPYRRRCVHTDVWQNLVMLSSCWSHIVPLAEERWHRRGHSQHRDTEHQEGKNQRWAAAHSGCQQDPVLPGDNLKLCVQLSIASCTTLVTRCHAAPFMQKVG